MRKNLILSLIFIMSFAIFAEDIIEKIGIDGERKGFIIGMGLGLNLGDYNFNQEKDTERLGFATNFKIGYAPKNDLEIYWYSKTGWIKKEDNNLAGFAGIGASKYINEKMFLAGGLGYATFQSRSNTSDLYKGLGLFIGAGYELKKHYYVELDLCYGNGRHEDDNDKKMDDLALIFTVNMLAF